MDQGVQGKSREITGSGGEITGSRSPLRVLVAPLDWGLGHTTRCIPIIRELSTQGATVTVAGNSRQQNLVQSEFPGIEFIPLGGYNVKYGKSGSTLFFQMLLQSPRILRTIKEENKWLDELLDKREFDAVISDNRYGLYSRKIPCIFITHQLHIRSHLGAWFERILQKRNYKYINRFTSCWVPDLEAGDSLAGELSHPKKMPSTRVRYIGSLSRFEKFNFAPVKNHLLILLSGPEPQRGILENKLINDIVHYNGTATIVRGLPGTTTLMPSTNQIIFYNHLPAADLAKEIGKAECVIARCGYSTVMDLVPQGVRTILIPTPGQTEQEYLGKYLGDKNVILCQTQKEFKLQPLLSKLKDYRYSSMKIENPGLLAAAVTELLEIAKRPRS